MKVKQLAFDGITRRKPKKKELNDDFALQALKKQSVLVLDQLKAMGGEQYPEKILKAIRATGLEFELRHCKASLKWLLDHTFVTKETRDRVSYYRVKEAI